MDYIKNLTNSIILLIPISCYLVGYDADLFGVVCTVLFTLTFLGAMKGWAFLIFPTYWVTATFHINNVDPNFNMFGAREIWTLTMAIFIPVLFFYILFGLFGIVESAQLWEYEDDKANRPWKKRKN